MFYIIQTRVDDDRSIETQVFGPYGSHAEANSAMQGLYDQSMKECEDADGDDSDASHFQVAGDDTTYHWEIFEIE